MAIRNILPVVFICLYVGVYSQQKLSVSPYNPDYLKFRQEIEAGTELQAAPSPCLPDFKQYFKEKSVKVPKAYPIAFDLRTAGPGGTSLLTSVKHQLNCGACWAFATYGSVEGTWKMAGLGDYDLSENNLKNCHGFDLDPCEWGHHFMSTAYLVRGSGPISEENDPYNPTGPECFPGYVPEAYLPESAYLPEDHDAFKEAIMNTGPVYNTYRSVSGLYQWIYGHYTYCYQGGGTTSHAIAIVGWNDTLTTACGTGAWLCKNEYGTNFGENGYFYISYQDTLVLKYNSIWPVREMFHPKRIIHQYDTIGGWPFIGYSDTVAFGLVKFVAGIDQFLTAVGTYTVSYGTSLLVEIYDDFDGNNLAGLQVSVPEQTLAFPGFHQISLPDTLRLTQGEDFYICIRYVSPGNVFPMAIEGIEEGYTNPHIQTSMCWSKGPNGSWDALGTGTPYLFDLCIKAFAFEVTRVDIRVFLEGPFQSGSMIANLAGMELLPLEQPYNQPPWNYNGPEAVTSVPANIVDWVLLELRETGGSAETATTATRIGVLACLLTSDGNLIDPVTLSTPVFDVAPIQNLYCIVYHRNHLPVMSSGPMVYDNGIYSWDFTTGQQMAFGNNPALKEIGFGIYGLLAGNGSADGVIDFGDKETDWEAETGKRGYLPSDFNLDGQAENCDKNNFWLSNLGLFTEIPE